MIGMVQRKVRAKRRVQIKYKSILIQVVTMAAGMITRTGLRATAVDFSSAVFFSGTGLVSRKPGPLPKYLAILWPYTTVMWLVIVIAVVVTIIVYWAFSKLGPSGYGIHFDFMVSCKQIAMVLLLQSKHGYYCA